jgi:hypothetical protein
MTSRLLIFAKNPIPGKVKTRLAESIGNSGAVEVYLNLLKHTMDVVRKSGLPTQIWLSDRQELHPFFAGFGFDIHRQEGNDLGERMNHAFEKSFRENPRSPVIIIGSDCPELSADILLEASQKLAEQEMVIGPATDGGYYLIGLKQAQPELFLNKSWSHPNVFKEALHSAEKLNISVQLLPQLSDIDEKEDWLRLKHLLKDI